MTASQEIVGTVAPYLGELALAVFTALVAFLSKGLANLIRAKASSATQAATLERLTDAVTTAVLEVAQTMRGPMVEAAQRGGKLRPEDAETLRRAASRRAQELLTDAGWIALVSFAGGEKAARALIDARIERTVLESKSLTQ